VTTARVAALKVIVNSVCIIAPAAQIRQVPADLYEERQPADCEYRGEAAQRDHAATAEQQALLTGYAAALGILRFLSGP